ncbi:hypothetical protein ACFY8S_01540 [Streptomyces hygroscopicus]|uniref:hypothetical protein n=1 Tax=Streptomyces hygroscopicus TaxID=1912 RepID=UPI0036C772C3
MTSSAHEDVTVLVHGVRAGGDPDRVESLETALRRADGRPLTVEELEAAVLLQWDRVTYEEQRRMDAEERPVSPGAEAVGFARIYPPEQASALPGQAPAYALAASWYGWLPGVYATRKAALLAYGYVLGGEAAGNLEELRGQVLRRERQPIGVRDLITFSGAGE